MERSVSELTEKLGRAEQALERSERLAVASRYAGAMMHEVNNPLEAITNLVYLTKLPKPTRTSCRNLSVIEEQLKTLGRVTSQALTFHREQQVAKEIDLVEIAESALKLDSDRLIRYSIGAQGRYRGPVLSTVFGSEILQVVSNLILNAPDVLDDGKGVICVGVKRCPQCIHITVADNGPGIPERLTERLFGPNVTSKSSGTGFGLAFEPHHQKTRWNSAF